MKCDLLRCLVSFSPLKNQTPPDINSISYLALTRINQFLENDQQIIRNPLRCDTETTWAYSRFEPTLAVANGTAKQTFYSRLQPNQAPSLSINTLGLQWNIEKSKETVSLAVQSNRNKRHLEVLTAETLLVIQLHCQRVNFSSENWLYDYEMPLSPNKVHLLALINRQVTGEQTTRQSTIRERDQLNQVGLGSSRRDRDVPKILGSTLAESQNDYPGRRNSSNGGGSSSGKRLPSTKREIMDYSLSTMRPTKELPGISQRIDLSRDISRGLSIAVLANQNKSDANKPNDVSLLGPTYLTELDSMRIRLKSSSILLFTISSSIIILIYTLCLFIYLKSRRRNAKASNESSHKRSQSIKKRSARTVEAAFRKEAKSDHVQDISEPFNLQMSPATRTRLNMILGRGSTIVANSVRFNPTSLQSTRGSHVRDTANQDNLVAFDNNHVQPQREAQFELEGAGYTESSCRVDHKAHKKSRTATKSHLAHGSVNVVRAIQQAATLARSRLRNSRYHPNLNVIPETDVEHLQSLPRSDLNYSNGLFIRNNLDQCHQADTISTEQFNSLVQDAMSRDCSHIIKKIYQEPTKTLFSKPCGLATKCPSVSRSRILHQLKQENVYEEHNRL